MSTCGQCTHYVGMGDWSLCCDMTPWLVYEQTDASSCASFVQTDECRNVSRIVGGFYCSICGERGWDSIVRDGRCPNCGNTVEGSLFG